MLLSFCGAAAKLRAKVTFVDVPRSHTQLDTDNPVGLLQTCDQLVTHDDELEKMSANNINRFWLTQINSKCEIQINFCTKLHSLVSL